MIDMTIDETIEQERRQAEIYKLEYESECTFYGTKFVDEHSGNFDCIKKMHEHEQYAEWFEELKELRANSCGYSKEDIELNRNAMYNKAIDDFVEKVELKYLGVHPDELYEKYYPREICEQIKEISEQLKERELNDRNFNRTRKTN